MKHPLLVLMLFFVVAFDSFCQIQGYREDTIIPTFDLNFLILKSSDKPEKKFEFLNTALADFLEKFPNPDKNEDYYYEMDEVMARLISYNTSELYFLKNKLSDFRFQDSKFSIGNGENFIKVGDHYLLVEKLFPTYEIDIDSNYITKNKCGVIRITSSNGEIVFDETIVIIFNLENGKITELLF
jgi:hypothetical protein